MEEKLILYDYFRSSTCYRVRIALQYKNIAYDKIEVHLLNNGGEQHQDSYRRINPMSEVPTLKHGDFYLSQSLPILEYLDEVFPQNPIFPSDTKCKFKIKQFCENINSFMHPIANLKVLQYLEKSHGYDQDQKKKWVQYWMAKGYSALETLVEKSNGQYCFGDSITAADITLIPQMFSSSRFSVDFSQYPKLQSINKHCLTLQCFAPPKDPAK